MYWSLEVRERLGHGSIPSCSSGERGAGTGAKEAGSGETAGGGRVGDGDLLDPPTLAPALAGVDKLFLLNAVAADELTQALIAFGMARRAGVKHITYLSVYKVDAFPDVPHFASKLAVEGALHAGNTEFTILRPGFFYQNELGMQAVMQSAGIYPMPIGAAGIAAVDVRDIAAAAAITLTTPGHSGRTTAQWDRASSAARKRPKAGARRWGGRLSIRGKTGTHRSADATVHARLAGLRSAGDAGGLPATRVRRRGG